MTQENTPPPASSPSEPSSGSRLKQFWKTHGNSIWKSTKTAGIIFGVVGTALGMFVDFRETSDILQETQLQGNVSNVVTPEAQAPEPPEAEKVAVCGDGVIDPGEECDDGNTLHGDLCAPECTSNVVRIKGGTFIKGFSKADLDGGMHLLVRPKNDPEHSRRLAQWASPATTVMVGSFTIMRTEVSWNALRSFLEDTTAGALTEPLERLKNGQPLRPNSISIEALPWYEKAMAATRERYDPEQGIAIGWTGGDNLPATVSLETAVSFCAWLGGSVPVEELMEFAARGPGGKRTYPWGDRAPKSSPEDCELVTGYFPVSLDPLVEFNCGGREPTPVGSLPAGCTPEGVCDLSGNVDEWVMPGAVIWKEVVIDEWSPDPFYIAMPAGTQRDGKVWGRRLSICSPRHRDDPFGMVSGWVSDCIRSESGGVLGEEKRYPADRALYILKGGNNSDSHPVLYQSRARFPYARPKLNKGFRCINPKLPPGHLLP